MPNRHILPQEKSGVCKFRWLDQERRPLCRASTLATIESLLTVAPPIERRNQSASFLMKAPLAVLADNLLANETLEGEQAQQIVRPMAGLIWVPLPDR